VSFSSGSIVKKSPKEELFESLPTSRRYDVVSRINWPRLLTTVGNICILVGAVDPMEGSFLILPGSGLIALGFFVSPDKKHLITYRMWAFFLIAFGVVALWVLSIVGGFGGATGLSNWWGVLILPYLIGWTMSVWGPASPGWVLWFGMANGLWYMTILAMAMKGLGDSSLITNNLSALVLGLIGLITIVGCIYRLRHPSDTEK